MEWALPRYCIMFGRVLSVCDIIFTSQDALRVIQGILHATNNAMAVAKLRGCPISLNETSLIMMSEQFNMYTTEKKKVVREMVVFLHHHYIIFAVDLMGGKEYDYWEHIQVYTPFWSTHAHNFALLCMHRIDTRVSNLVAHSTGV